jgi:hypothetical protein
MNADMIFAWLAIAAGIIVVCAVAGIAGYGVYRLGVDILEEVDDYHKAKANLERLDAAKAKRDAANAEWKRERAAQEERIARRLTSY